MATPVSTAVREDDAFRVLDSVSLVAGGDVLLHVSVQASAAWANQTDASGASVNHGGYDVLLSDVAQRFRSADIAFVNLETPVAPRSGASPRPFVFNAPASVPGALEAAGIDVVSVANNHVYDQGRRGLLETLEHLDETSLEVIGAGSTCPEARRPALREVRSLKVAFIGTSEHFNAHNLNGAEDDPCAFELDEAAVVAQVRAARAAGADLVVLSVHWGAEYQTQPAERTVELAHRLLEQGVDVILGHHPHVLQPVEAYLTSDGRETLVAYSLGNLISNQAYDYHPRLHEVAKAHTRDGMLLQLRALKVMEHGRTRIRLAGVQAVPLWTTNDYLLQLRQPGPRFIRVAPIDELTRDLTQASAPMRTSRQERERERWLEVLDRRRYEVEKIVGRDVVSRPPDRQPAGSSPSAAR